MEKLFKLLQIYIIERQGREEFKLNGDKIILWRPYKFRKYPQYDTNAVIISKRFGFIQRLVENDKINLLQLDNRIALSMSIEFNKVERVLMALSISDTPIEDLISYLK